MYWSLTRAPRQQNLPPCLHVCSRVRVSKPPCSGGHHLNLILLATLGTCHGDNRSLALSTKRMRTFLSRHTESPLHGEVCQHACAPAKRSSKIKVDIHLQKCTPLSLKENYPPYALHGRNFYFFSPQNGLPDTGSQESCGNHPSCGSPLTLGLALVHQQLTSLPQDIGQPEMLVPEQCLCSFRTKKLHGASIS